MTNTSSLSEMTVEVGRLVAETALVVGRLEPRDLPASGVTSLLDRFIELERRAAAGRLLLAARAAESNKWKRQGFRSAAEWFAAQSGTTTGRAKEDLATSERLEGLDDTADAVRDGRLSPEQASAISDAAAVNPAAEAGLLGAAQGESLKGLKDRAAGAKAEVEDLDTRETRIRKQRRCRTWVDREGAWNLSARGPLVAGSAFEVEWERLINRHFTDARLAGQRESHDNYAFDALMTMADTKADAKGGGNGGSRDNLRHLALIRVDLDALIRGHVERDERCEIAGLGPISVTAARELLGDSILKLVVTRGVDVANISHLGRGPTTAQHVALLWTRPNCTVAGCNRQRRLQIDHRQPWAAKRETHLGNLDPLCEHHHHLKTRDRWALIDGTGVRQMVPPTDRRHPENLSRAGSNQRGP